MSPKQQLAEDLIELLNGETWGLPFVAERKFEPETRTLEEFQDLRCTVVVAAERKSSVARTKTQRDVDVDVAFQQKPDARDNEQLDPLDDLSEDVGTFLLRRVVGDDRFRCIAVEYKGTAPWIPEHLKEKHLWTSVVTATFRRIE